MSGMESFISPLTHFAKSKTSYLLCITFLPSGRAAVRVHSEGKQAYIRHLQRAGALRKWGWGGGVQCCSF